MAGRWAVTAYRNHKAVGDVTGLRKREALRLVAQLNSAEPVRTRNSRGEIVVLELAGRMYKMLRRKAS